MTALPAPEQRSLVKGDRVKLSAHGKENFPRTPPDRLGTVIRMCRNDCVLIHWDGCKPPHAGAVTHVSHIELVTVDDLET